VLMIVCSASVLWGMGVFYFGWHSIVHLMVGFALNL
jgi:hypothetical protein